MMRSLEEENVEADEGNEISILEILIGLWLFLILIGVGASCERPLLRKMIRSPRALKAATVGIFCQFGIMPLVAYLLTLIFGVDGYPALGFLLAGCMPGGGPSNVFTLLSNGVLELSVFMTVVSTLLALVMTPLLLFLYSRAIGIEETSNSFGIIAVSLGLLMIPLSLGFALNSCKPEWKERIKKLLGLSMLVVVVSAGISLFVEYWDDVSATWSFRTLVPALLFFPLGTGISYGLASLLGMAPSIKRTIVLEVGMQNITLGILIMESMLDERESRVETLPFPIIYAFAMYNFSMLLVPLFRYQKQYNENNGIVDQDDDLFVADPVDESADKPEQTQNTDREADIDASTEAKKAYQLAEGE